MITIARKLMGLFTRRERWQFAGVLAAMIAMGLLQVAGVGSVMPFVSLLANPDQVNTNAQLNWAYTTFGFSNVQSFLLFMGLVVLGILLLSNVFISITIWLMTRFAWANQERLSRQLLAHYLTRPYIAFLDRNSADASKNILSEMQVLTNGVILPFMNTIAYGITVLFIVALLLSMNWLVALVAAAIFGGGYVTIFLAVRKVLTRAGQQRLAANTLRFKVVGEAFGGIKEVKVRGREWAFVRQFTGPARRFARAMVWQQCLGQVPRYGIEVLAFGSILLLILYLLDTRGNAISVLPMASVYAFAGYRLMSATQQIYQGFSQMRFSSVVIDLVAQEMQEMVDMAPPPPPSDGPSLPFRHALKVDSVSFSYPNTSTPAVRDVALTIPKGDFVAFVGSTGAGKTTLGDIILGLLQPQAGFLKVDDVVLSGDNLRSWQDKLGYVPQDIYLTDDTVAANIAFGIPAEQQDRKAIERAARVANIHDFIVGELPRGYDTIVGERGVRLSGGQRQRIGIARALYHDPEVLVLDEATSNLDQATEAAVHRAIREAAATKTVIMIAHRLSTTQYCDTLYLLEHGRIVAQGSYEHLLATSGTFQTMVGVR